MSKAVLEYPLNIVHIVALCAIVWANSSWVVPIPTVLLQQLVTYAGFLGMEWIFVAAGYYIGVNAFAYTQETFLNANGLNRVVLPILTTTYFIYGMVVCGLFLGLPQDIEVFIGEYFVLIQNFISKHPIVFPEAWLITTLVWNIILWTILIRSLSKFSDLSNSARVLRLLAVLIILMACCLRFQFLKSTAEIPIDTWNTSLKQVVIYRLDALAIGVLMGALLKNFTWQFRKWRLAFAGLGCLLLLFLVAGVGALGLHIHAFPVFWTVFYLPLVAIALGCFLPLLHRWEGQTKFHTRKLSAFQLLLMGYLVHYSLTYRLVQSTISMEYFNNLSAVLRIAIYGSILLCMLFLSHLLVRLTSRLISQLTQVYL